MWGRGRGRSEGGGAGSLGIYLHLLPPLVHWVHARSGVVCWGLPWIFPKMSWVSG